LRVLLRRYGDNGDNDANDDGANDGNAFVQKMKHLPQLKAP